MEAILDTRASTPAYEPPALLWERDEGEVEPVVWWAIIVGFSYALALAWAAYCIRRGGDPEISFSWRGFKVTCQR